MTLALVLSRAVRISTCVGNFFCRTNFKTSMPSMSGKPRSSSIISGGSATTCVQAALPVANQFTAKPARDKALTIPSASSSSSSTNKICIALLIHHKCFLALAMAASISSLRPASADSRPGRGAALSAFSNATTAC